MWNIVNVMAMAFGTASSAATLPLAITSLGENSNKVTKKGDAGVWTQPY